MFPRWHIFFGILFTFLIWIAAPHINFVFLLLILFSSILIDFDHYLCSVFKTKRLGFFHALRYNNKIREEEQFKKAKGIKEKSDFHIFHTIEFHILIGLLSFLWTGFFYIFLGMVFHSLLDLYSMFYDKSVYFREYFFINWLHKKLKKTNKSLSNQKKSSNPQQKNRN